MSGMYVLWFVVCDAQHAGCACADERFGKIDGICGPGRSCVFGFATSAHLGLGFLWAIACATNWRYVLGLHNCITVVDVHDGDGGVVFRLPTAYGLR